MKDPISFLDPKYRPIVKRYTSFSPSQINSLAKRLGVFVEYYDPENDNEPALHYEEHLGFGQIWIRSDISDSKKRYFLAKGLSRWMLKDRMPVSEQTLSDLATEIIMPAQLIAEYCRLNNCDPKYHEKIAQHFIVTKAALQFRLKQLGFVWEDEAENA